MSLPIEIWQIINSCSNLITSLKLKSTCRLFYDDLIIQNNSKMISDVKLKKLPAFLGVRFFKDGIFLNITKHKPLDVGKYNNEYKNYHDEDDFGWFLIKKALVGKQLTRTAISLILEHKSCCIEQAIIQLRSLKMVKIS